jgi:hypothetical protein
MSELWSAQQREWLQAMGHTVLALAGAEAVAEPAPAQRGGERSDAGAANDASSRSEPARERATPAQAGRNPPAPGGADSALLRNLLRAARRDAGDAQVLALFDAPALRGDPAAKRALWPRLRALRRGAARG